ncbi:MAG: OprD family outer membrane porin [Verrucomicrobiota bacterium]
MNAISPTPTLATGLGLLLLQLPLSAQQQEATTSSSLEQGQTSIDEAFDWQQWRLETRREALKDTTFKFNLRTYYMNRENFDDTENEAWAAGGWAGLKTGYFLDHISLGLTGYTSQHLHGGDDTDGTLLLAPGQESYSVLGELYADVRIVDGLNLVAGRKEFDTPFINRNDTRMTPNTFEAIALQGVTELKDGASIKYGAGYFDQIKERNSDDFVSMSVDAGATVERGVFTAGGLYKKGNFSFGGIDYYSEDIINIAYLEAKLEVPVCNDWKVNLAAQYVDQRSVGEELLPGGAFDSRQFGIKAEVPVGDALFTAAYTDASGDSNLQNPWSGYPGYTSVQVQDFNREGEGAFLLRAGYEFAAIEGLSAYALGVFGTEPDQPGEYRQDEYDLNLQWAPTEGAMKGLSLRLRYGFVQQDGGDDDTFTDFRVICNYAFVF